jgi:hypothetical protein
MIIVNVASNPRRRDPEVWGFGESRARARRDRATAREQMDCETNIRRYGSFCTCGTHEPLLPSFDVT